MKRERLLSVWLVLLLMCAVLVPLQGFCEEAEEDVNVLAEQALVALDGEDYEKAAEILRGIAESDYTPKVMFAIGWCFNAPKCFGGSAEAAFSYYLRAAREGYAPAQKATAICYKNGLGATENMTKAEHWYREAAKQGMKEAQYQLGIMFCYAKGVERDYEECREWLQKSAEQGYMPAIRQLGILSDNNPAGWEAKKGEAAKWYKEAAKLGDKRSAYTLAELALKDDDHKEAQYWIQVAAENGHAQAQWNMAGVSSTNEDIVMWADKAAHNGHLEASLTLAEYYREVDKDKAAQYLALASRAGSRVAQIKLSRFKNSEKKPTLLGLSYKGATRQSIEDHLNGLGVAPAEMTSEGVAKFRAAKMQRSNSTLVWVAYDDSTPERLLKKVQYDLPVRLETTEEISNFVKELEDEFGIPYNHSPLRINPHKQWQIFWALPEVDVTLEHVPQKGVFLKIVPVS